MLNFMFIIELGFDKGIIMIILCIFGKLMLVFFMFIGCG